MFFTSRLLLLLHIAYCTRNKIRLVNICSVSRYSKYYIFCINKVKGDVLTPQPSSLGYITDCLSNLETSHLSLS